MLEYLLFLAYLLLFAWLVTQTRFFLRSGLTRPQLVILFLLKVIAGTFYGWVGIYYGGLAQMVDTWAYHDESLREYQLLVSSPSSFFTDLFHNPYSGGFSSFFSSTNSYWNDLKGNVFIKLLSIFNIFSLGNYYVNVIFYAYITLFGPIAIYRVMANVFRGKEKLVFIGTFLVPSFFYWTSGLHKDGLIFLGVSLIIYHLYFGFKEKKFPVKRWLGILLGFFLFLLLRNFLIVLIAPSIFAWWLSNKWPRYTAACFLLTFLCFCVLFFTVRYIDPRLDFPQVVVDKQQAFLQLVNANSVIPIKELKPTPISFLANTSQAILLSTVRPYPSDIHHLLSLVAAIEIQLLLLLLLIFFLFHKKNDITTKPLTYFCVSFAISLLLTVGFSVNNLGAIVRYRSIIIPLVMIPVLVSIDWERLGKLISNIKKKYNN